MHRGDCAEQLEEPRRVSGAGAPLADGAGPQQSMVHHQDRAPVPAGLSTTRRVWRVRELKLADILTWGNIHAERLGRRAIR